MAFTYDLARFLTFRDARECARVRAIKRADLTEHKNRDFHIRIMDDPGQFYGAFATDIVVRIKEALDEGRQFVGICPVGPMPQYAIAANLINRLRLPMKHVHTFNMDEYADQDGNTAPAAWDGSFQRAMMEQFFERIDEDLRPPLKQIHFPTTDDLPDYAKRIADLGGGVSWQRFIARLCAHGRVNTLVPGSILQTVPGDYTFLGAVADDVEIHMA